MDTAFAQTAASAAGSAPMAGIISFLPMILIIGLFYFIMIVPQSKERKKARGYARRNPKRGSGTDSRGSLWNRGRH